MTMNAQWSVINEWRIKEGNALFSIQEFGECLQEEDTEEWPSPLLANTSHMEMEELNSLDQSDVVYTQRKPPKRKISFKTKQQRARLRRRELRASLSEEELALLRKKEAAQKRALREKSRNKEFSPNRDEDEEHDSNEQVEKKPIVKQVRAVKSKASRLQQNKLDINRIIDAASQRERRAKLTKEELALRRKKDADRKRALREKLRDKEYPMDHEEGPEGEINEPLERKPIINIAREIRAKVPRRSMLPQDKLDVERTMDAARKRERRAKLTEEELALRRKKDAERKRAKRAKLTGVKLALPFKEPERRKSGQVKSTEKQLSQNRKETRVITAKTRRSMQPQDKRMLERIADAARKRERRAKLTEEELALRRKKDADRKRALRAAQIELEMTTGEKKCSKKLKEMASANNDGDDPLSQIKRLRIFVAAIKKSSLEQIRNSVKSKVDCLKGLTKTSKAEERKKYTKKTERKGYKLRQRDVNQHKEKYPIISFSEKQFICIVCDEEFDTKIGIRQHLSFHEELELSEAKEKYSSFIANDASKWKTESVLLSIYICEVCSEKCCSLALYRKHIIDKHKDNREIVKKMCFPCSFCDEAFMAKKTFTAHQRDLHNVFTQCPVCRESFENQVSFAKHVNVIHPDCGKNGDIVFEYEEGYFCKECGVCSRSYNYVSTHVKDFHSENVSFGCEQCNMKFNTRMDLTGHQRKFHEEKLFCCEVCGESFGTKCFLKLHKRKHKINASVIQRQTEEKVKCKDCGKILANKKTYRHHHMAIHQKKTFNCTACGKSFKYQSFLHRHRINFCEKEKAIATPCSVCGKILDNYAALSYHKSNFHKYGNTEETVCHLCNKSFKAPFNLLIHNRSNHNLERNRILTCSVCGRTSTNKIKLLNHWRLHREESPFKCSLCQVTFKCKYRFHRHREVAHKGVYDNPEIIIDFEVDERIRADFNQAHSAQFMKNVETGPIVEPAADWQINANYGQHKHLQFNEAIYNLYGDIGKVGSNVAGKNNTENNYVDFSRANVPVISDVRQETTEEIETANKTEETFESRLDQEETGAIKVIEDLNVSQENQTADVEFIGVREFFEQMECLSQNEYSDTDSIMDMIDNRKPSISELDYRNPSISGLDNNKTVQLTKRLVIEIERLRECPLCNDLFPSSATYKNHLNSKGHRLAMRAKKKDSLLTKEEKIVSGHKKPKEDTLLPCPFCKEMFTSVCNYTQHTAEHRKRDSLICVICSKVFSKPRILVDHYISDHNGENIVKCETCGMGFLDKKTCGAHVAYTHNNRRYVYENKYKQQIPCDICGEKIKNAKTFKTHILSHEDEMHKCVHCAEEFKILAEFERHYHKDHNGEMPFQCDDCLLKFATKLRLKMHKKENHLKDGNVKEVKTQRAIPYEARKKQVYQEISCSLCGETFFSKNKYKSHMLNHNIRVSCLLCDAGFATVKKLKSHYMSVHNGDKLVKCDLCDTRFLDYQNLRLNLRVHMAIEHDVRRKNRDTKSFPCDVCGLITRGEKLLAKHLATHKNDKHKCAYCNAELESVIELESHYNETHNGEKPFPCPECSLKFCLKPRLQLHIKEAHPNSSYTQDNFDHTAPQAFCEFCGKFFSGEDSLNQHLKEHAGDKPYQCTICNMTFVSSATLKEHADEVHKLPLHPCDVCGITFNRRRNLLKHCKSVHSIGKNADKNPEYNCHICSEPCGFPKALQRHMKLHDLNRRFVCELCSWRFLSSSNLCNHKTKMHKKIGKTPKDSTKI